jgi:hypothetical protein
MQTLWMLPVYLIAVFAVQSILVTARKYPGFVAITEALLWSWWLTTLTRWIGRA